MKYAASMRYGGQLVDASECDYEDYNYLKLLCPECKDAVFLRASGSRIVKDKEVKVGAHFCHFPGKDASLIAQCENRVSKYTPKELQRKAAIARGQRLKILQSHFLDILALNKYTPVWEEAKSLLPGVPESEIEDIIDSGISHYWVTNILNDWHCASSELKSVFQYYLLTLLEMTKGDYKKYLDATGYSFEFRKKLHMEICLEVIDFLGAKRSKPLLKRLLCLAAIDFRDAQDRGWAQFSAKVFKTDGMKICAHLAWVIGTTPWADGFGSINKPLQ